MKTVAAQVLVAGPVMKGVEIHEGPQYKKHWKDGGLAITNFDESELSHYASAISIYGDPNLCISEACGDFPRSMYALSYKNFFPSHDLSEFWRMFDSIRHFFKVSK